MSILYFANWNGSGHWQRANSILKHLYIPTIVIFYQKPDYIELEPLHQFIQIDPIRIQGDARFVENQAIHIPELFHQEYLHRTKNIIDICAEHKVKYAILDISMELAMVMRLCAIPYLSTVLHGDRSDMAQTHTFKCADRLLATYPLRLEQDFPDWQIEKTIYTGGVVKSYDDTITDNPFDDIKKSVVLIIKPKGNSSFSNAYFEKVAIANPDYFWCGINFDEESTGENHQFNQFVERSDIYIKNADYLVINPGNNSILEAGYYNKPFMTKPEKRFFDEHLYKVEALKRENLAVVIEDWSEDIKDWSDYISQLDNLDSWEGLVSKDGAKQAADHITQRYQYYTES